MKQKNSHLLTLIKLQEGHLSAAQGVAVREQFASNPLLLKQWQELSDIYKNQTSLEENTERNHPEIKSEWIAAFVEESMSFHEQEEFEPLCWGNTTVLREVISAYQAVHSDSSSADTLHTEQASKRMLEVAMMQCNQVESVKYLQEIEKHPQTSHELASFDSFDVDTLDPPAAFPKRRSKKRATQKEQYKTTKQLWLYVVAAAVVVAIAVPLYFAMRHQDENSGTIPIVDNLPSSENEIPPDKKKPSTQETIPNLVRTPDKKKEIDPLPKPPSIDSNDKGNPVVMKKDPKVDVETQPDLQIAWTQLSGIIGMRTDALSPWKGILAKTSAKNPNGIAATKNFALRTLPSSWLQGTIESGSQMVVDADSEIQIAIHGLKKQGTTSKSDLIETIINLNLVSGKVAFSQLQKGDELWFRESQQEWKIQVTQNGTSVGLIQQDDNTKKIMVFAGEVNVTSLIAEKEVPLQSEQMVVMNERSITDPEKVIRKQRWVAKEPKALKVSKTFIDSMNQSDNLLAALFSTASSGKATKESLISTHLGFSLNPVASVPRAAFSKLEVQRTAAIQWLIDTKESEKTRSVWGKINRANQAKQSTVSLRPWFKAARNKSKVTPKTLAELSVGLGAKQSLFVRQCAIQFLRQITRKRLAEYDPNKPTNAAINSVRQKTRRATGNRTRRGR